MKKTNKILSATFKKVLVSFRPLEEEGGQKACVCVCACVCEWTLSLSLVPLLLLVNKQPRAQAQKQRETKTKITFCVTKLKSAVCFSDHIFGDILPMVLQTKLPTNSRTGLPFSNWSSQFLSTKKLGNREANLTPDLQVHRSSKKKQMCCYSKMGKYCIIRGC